MRQCELKKRYDPDLDAYVTQHIYGEGISDVFQSIGRKLFGKAVKSAAKSAAKTAVAKAATTTGEYAGKKAGDKIVELLSGKKTTSTPSLTPSFPIESNMSTPNESNELTDQEVYDRVNRILSGGKLRRRNFI